MTEEESLAAKYRKFNDNGKRVYDSLSYEQMQGVLKAMHSGKLEVIGPDGKPVKFDKGEE
ncbi:hypothetical protein [Tabrizicola sp.]|uniref:hypothetical protein n=1 Tax=Tabrizicola sp. TaxID=2005166 RepID=UPI003D2A5A7F